jgi:hypothetical protein
MSDKPIIFSAPMVRALIDGTKTQTRRLFHNNLAFGVRESNLVKSGFEDRHGREIKVPFQPGDRLWVRENFYAEERRKSETGYVHLWLPQNGDSKESPPPGIRCVHYMANHRFEPIKNTPEATEAWIKIFNYGDKNGERPEKVVGRIIPSIHMPRWASRITLNVTEIRLQRLQAITEDDAVAEGVVHETTTASGKFYRNYDNPACPISAYGAFRSLWNHLHGGEEAWAENPWVIAITFTTKIGNIDDI